MSPLEMTAAEYAYNNGYNAAMKEITQDFKQNTAYGVVDLNWFYSILLEHCILDRDAANKMMAEMCVYKFNDN